MRMDVEELALSSLIEVSRCAAAETSQIIYDFPSVAQTCCFKFSKPEVQLRFSFHRSCGSVPSLMYLDFESTVHCICAGPQTKEKST